jgi:Zn-dependent protease
METLIGIIILILSIIIHEVAHGYAAESLGDSTARYAGRLTLNPIPHIDPIGSVLLPIITSISGGFIFGWAKPVPYNPYNLRHGTWGEALVALAGPASNLALVLIFGLAMRFAPLPPGMVEIFGLIVLVNISLAVFNLVPIPPLDGSKILFALLPYRAQQARFFLERYGFFLVIIFVIFLSPVLGPIVRGIFSLVTGFGL